MQENDEIRDTKSTLRIRSTAQNTVRDDIIVEQEQQYLISLPQQTQKRQQHSEAIYHQNQAEYGVDNTNEQVKEVQQAAALNSTAFQSPEYEETQRERGGASNSYLDQVGYVSAMNIEPDANETTPSMVSSPQQVRQSSHERRQKQMVYQLSQKQVHRYFPIVQVRAPKNKVYLTNFLDQHKNKESASQKIKRSNNYKKKVSVTSEQQNCTTEARRQRNFNNYGAASPSQFSQDRSQQSQSSDKRHERYLNEFREEKKLRMLEEQQKQQYYFDRNLTSEAKFSTLPAATLDQGSSSLSLQHPPPLNAKRVLKHQISQQLDLRNSRNVVKSITQENVKNQEYKPSSLLPRINSSLSQQDLSASSQASGSKQPSSNQPQQQELANKPSTLKQQLKQLPLTTKSITEKQKAEEIADLINTPYFDAAYYISQRQNYDLQYNNSSSHNPPLNNIDQEQNPYEVVAGEGNGNASIPSINVHSRIKSHLLAAEKSKPQSVRHQAHSATSLKNETRRESVTKSVVSQYNNSQQTISKSPTKQVSDQVKARKMLKKVKKIDMEVNIRSAQLAKSSQRILSTDQETQLSHSIDDMAELESHLKSKVQLLDEHLRDPSAHKDKIMIPAVHKMPEPSKKYVSRERSSLERKQIVNNLQNLMMYKEITSRESIPQQTDNKLQDQSIQYQDQQYIDIKDNFTAGLSQSYSEATLGPSAEGSPINAATDGSPLARVIRKSIKMPTKHFKKLNQNKKQWSLEELYIQSNEALGVPSDFYLNYNSGSQSRKNETKAMAPPLFIMSSNPSPIGVDSPKEDDYIDENLVQMDMTQFPALQSPNSPLETPNDVYLPSKMINNENQRILKTEISPKSKIRNILMMPNNLQGEKNQHEFRSDTGSQQHQQSDSYGAADLIDGNDTEETLLTKQADIDYNFNVRFEKKIYGKVISRASKGYNKYIDNKRLIKPTADMGGQRTRQIMMQATSSQSSLAVEKNFAKIEYLNILKDNNGINLSLNKSPSYQQQNFETELSVDAAAGQQYQVPQQMYSPIHHINTRNLKGTRSVRNCHSRLQQQQSINNNSKQSINSKLYSKDLTIVTTTSQRDDSLQPKKANSVKYYPLQSQQYPQVRGGGFTQQKCSLKTLKQKRIDIIHKVGQSKQDQSSFMSKIDSQATMKLMDGTKQNYQEFIKNKQLISRFDPQRKENIVKKQLEGSKSSLAVSYKDYPRLNIFSTQTSEPLVKNIAKLNFKKIFDQNLPRLVQDSGLERQDIINLYTRFVSIYMLQQIEDPQFTNKVELSQLREIDLATIKKTSKTLKLQSQQVVDRMLDHMRLATCSDKLCWEEFYQMITTLLPTNLEDRLRLFLRSYVPKNLAGKKVDKFKFGKEDILKIAIDCLKPMFKVTNDDFFQMLTTNYAQIIYKIIGLEWNQDPDQPEQKISLNKLKKHICQADGYEKDMLALLYGSTGIMDFDSKTNFVNQANLKEVSDLTPNKVITALIPDSGRNKPTEAEKNMNVDLVNKRQSNAVFTSLKQSNQNASNQPKVPKGKKVMTIGPEAQSQYTKNINIRKEAIGQMLQEDRDLQFPIYYKNKGVFLNQQRLNRQKQSGRYKKDESDYVQSRLKSKIYFSTKALDSHQQGEVKVHDFFQNSEKLQAEIQKNQLQQEELQKKEQSQSQKSLSSSKNLQRSAQALLNKQSHQRNDMLPIEQVQELSQQDEQSHESQEKTQQLPTQKDPSRKRQPSKYSMSIKNYMKVMKRRFGDSKDSVDDDKDFLSQPRNYQDSQISQSQEIQSSIHDDGLFLPELRIINEQIGYK